MASRGPSSDLSNWYSGDANSPVKSHQDAVKAPRPSQIPGFGDNDGQPTQPGHQFNRDADSDYSKMPKRGGRLDMLYDSPVRAATEHVPMKRQGANHTRSDWYYHDDPHKVNLPPKPAPAQRSTSKTVSFMESQGSNSYDQSYDGSSGEMKLKKDRSLDDFGCGPDQCDNVLESPNYHRDDSDYGCGNEFNPQDNQSNSSPAHHVTSINDGSNTNYNNNVKFPSLVPPFKSSSNPHVNRLTRDFSVKSDMSRLLSNGYLDERKASSKSGDSNNGLADNLERKAFTGNESTFKSDVRKHNDCGDRPSAGMIRLSSAQSEMSKLMSHGYLDKKKTSGRPGDDNVGHLYTSSWTVPSGDELRFPTVTHRPDVLDASSPSPVDEYVPRRKSMQESRPDMFLLGHQETRPDPYLLGRDSSTPTSTHQPQYGRRKVSHGTSKVDIFGVIPSYAPEIGRSQTTSAGEARDFRRRRMDPEVGRRKP